MTANPLPPIPPISATTGMAPPMGSGRFKPVDPLKVLREYAVILIAAGIVGVILGVTAWGLLRYFSPRYTSEAQLRVVATPQNWQESPGTDFLGGNSTAKENFMATEAMRLTSDQVLRPAMEDPVVRETDWFKSHKDVQSAAEALRKDSLSVSPIRGSDVIRLSVSTANQNDPPRVLSAVIQVYLRILRQEAQSSFSGVGSVLVAERARAEEEIRQLTQSLSDFTSQNNITSLVANQSEAAVIYNGLAKANMELNLALDQSKEVLQMMEQRMQEGTLEPTPDALMSIESSPSVLQITYQINQLKQSIASLTAQRGENHYSTRETKAQLAAAEAQKAAEIDRLVRDYQIAQLDNARKTVTTLQGQIESLRPKFSEAEARMTDLTNKLTRHQQMVDQLETTKIKRDEIEAELRGQRVMVDRPDAIPVHPYSSPTTPELSFPKIYIVVPFVTLLCLGVTGGLVFLRELLDQRVKSPSDVKLLPDVELLGVLPEASEDPSNPGSVERVVESAPTGLMAESFRQVRTALLAKMDRRGYKTLMIVGGQPGRGASSIAQNLATSLAYNGRKVIIVDANFRRPAQHRLAGIGNDAGLIDVLQERATLDEVIVATGASDIAVLPAGKAADAAPELFESPAFRAALSQLESRYDVIIIDAPPALLASESQLLAKYVDAMAIVVRASSDERGMVERMLRRLDGQRADVLGVILNGVRSSAGGYFRKSYREFYRYRDGAENETAKRGNGHANGRTNGQDSGRGRAAPKRENVTADLDD